MNLSAYVLAALLYLPPAHADEAEVGRQARMETIADAVRQATQRATCMGVYSKEGCEPLWPKQEAPEDLAALIITKGWWESRFAKNVHEGRCRSYECDAVKLASGVVIHRARTPWQFQRTSYSAPFWESMVGVELEPTRNAAWVAAQILSAGYRACRSYQGALNWYGVGRCESKKFASRYRTFLELRAMQPKFKEVLQ